MKSYEQKRRSEKSLTEIFVRNMEARRNAEQAFRDYPRGVIEEYIKPAGTKRYSNEYKSRFDSKDNE